MRIKQRLSQHRNDFTAVLECEFCKGTQRLTTGYDDGFYHQKVIPNISCANCGKSTDGKYPREDGTTNNNGNRNVYA